MSFKFYVTLLAKLKVQLRDLLYPNGRRSEEKMRNAVQCKLLTSAIFKVHLGVK